MQIQQQNPAKRVAVVLASDFGSQHRNVLVNRVVSRSVCRPVRHGRHPNALGTLSSGFRADALLLRNCAVGLRALGLSNTAQLLRNSPFSRSLSSLRALANKLPGSGLMLQTLWPAASARLKSSQRFEAARSAPDWRPIPSLRSVIPQAASRARCALDPAPHPSRLGTLPLLSLVGTRSCFCRDRLTQRWGASFSLLCLGASHHGSSALGGLRKLSLTGSEEFLPLPSVDKQSAFCSFRQHTTSFEVKGWAAGARPNQTSGIEQTPINRNSNIFQSTTQSINKE